MMKLMISDAIHCIFDLFHVATSRRNQYDRSQNFLLAVIDQLHLIFAEKFQTEVLIRVRMRDVRT